MFQKLKCRFAGHKVLCTAVIALNPDGTGDFEHMHECVKCGKSNFFPIEEVPSEIIAMLQRSVGKHDVQVKVNTDPPTYIH